MKKSTGILVGLLIITGIVSLTVNLSRAQEQRPRRRRSPVTKAELFKIYDITNPQVDLKKMMAPGVAKDGIPALTDPKRAKVSKASYPASDGRVAVVTINKKTVAYPIGILNFHEIANDTVGGTPIAVVYCPLCDSVSVMDRRLKTKDKNGKGTTRIVELGVSGLLLNSNVVMYDRKTMGLWSQVFMKAITGPDAGQSMTHLSVKMMSFDAYKKKFPNGEVLTTETGHRRPYDRNPYASYFESDQVFRGMDFGYDKRLTAKTLGMGIRHNDTIVFVTARKAKQGDVTITTDAGKIVVTSGKAGMTLKQAPKDTLSLQTFYHSWSAFYPQTKIMDVEK